MPKYYAVVNGRIPGIYTDWETTKQQVSGYPCAIYKSFPTKVEAEQFINTSTTNTTCENAIIVYTDGSYGNNVSGFGVVIILNDGTKMQAYGRVPLPPTNNVAELYAIYVALSLLRDQHVAIHTDSHYAASAFTAYIHDWIKHDWQGVPNKELLQTIYNLMQGRNVVFKHVRAHVGIPLNEEADQLADYGRQVSENLIVIQNGVRTI